MTMHIVDLSARYGVLGMGFVLVNSAMIYPSQRILISSLVDAMIKGARDVGGSALLVAALSAAAIPLYR